MLHLLRRHRYGLGRSLLAFVVVAWTALAYLPCAFAAERAREAAGHDAAMHVAANPAQPMHDGHVAHPAHDCCPDTADTPPDHPLPSHLLGCDDGRCLVMSSVESAPSPHLDLAAVLLIAPQPVALAPIFVAALPADAPALRGPPPERIPPSPVLAFRVLRI